jgi:hypothetical protein
MNTSIETPNPFEQNRADAWRKRRDLHFETLAGLNDAHAVRSESPPEHQMTLAWLGLLGFCGGGLWAWLYEIWRVL